MTTSKTTSNPEDLDALKAKWEERLASEGMPAELRSGLDQLVRQDRDIRKWFHDRGAKPIEGPGGWTYTADWYSRAQRVLTYWPYTKKCLSYLVLQHLVEAPARGPNLTLKDIRVLVTTSSRSPGLTTIWNRVKALETWVARFDFEDLHEWGPDSRVPDPVLYLIKRDNIPELELL
jgi:hypothetical protein